MSSGHSLVTGCVLELTDLSARWHRRYFDLKLDSLGLDSPFMQVSSLCAAPPCAERVKT
jgi:hypothetical protein